MNKVIGRASVVLTVFVWAGPAWTQTHDADFPEQMAAINRCYVEHIKSGKPPVSDPWTDKEFWACMKAQGFQFCDNCQIFRYSGGACRNDKKNGPDRPTCWVATKPMHFGDDPQCTEVSPGSGFETGGQRFVISKEAFDTNDDVERKVKETYGPNATIADWQTLKGLLATDAQLVEFIGAVGIPRQTTNGPCYNFLVSNHGQLKTSNRMWTFIARHDGKVPENWLVIDSIGNHGIDLGRWSYKSQALVVISQAAQLNSTTSIAPQTYWPEAPVLAVLNFDGKKAATFQYGDLRITVDSEPTSDQSERLPFVVGQFKEQNAFSIHLTGNEANGRDEPTAQVRLIKLDPSSTQPEVIFTYFWGGAHCCTVTRIASIDSGGAWHVVDGDVLDGDDGYEFIDLDGNGGSELVSVDNSFLYAFGCYACSYAPIRVQKLVGHTYLKDDTTQYQDFLRQRLRQMESSAKESGDQDTLRSPGFLGGWVAAKTLVGELSAAWQTMLSTYDPDPNWGMEECAEPLPMEKCPEADQRETNFPEALAAHLLTHGYITSEQKAKLSLDVPLSVPRKSNQQANVESDTSNPIGICARAINDPLRPMIIDMLVSNGKHISPTWTNTIKQGLEDGYGSFVRVQNDATVERVDQSTGKVGCAVTYEADLKGLAAKVLDEGATARAQILIHQIAQDGPVISRRLSYTVQETSGGSLMAWFGLPADTTEPPSPHHRSIAQCILSYGGRCIAWRR